jgi:hypothetical protein
VDPIATRQLTVIEMDVLIAGIDRDNEAAKQRR